MSVTEKVTFYLYTFVMGLRRVKSSEVEYFIRMSRWGRTLAERHREEKITVVV